MASLFRFFAFSALLIAAFVLWAFIDYKRNRKKADRYIRERLGVYGGFSMTRFVNMARVLKSDPDRFTGVFFRRGTHLEIADFHPDRVIDLPTDGVVLSDTSRNQTRIFVERGKTIYSLKIENFTPRGFSIVKRGTGRVQFLGEEMPASNKDWFLIDPDNGRSISPPLKETEPWPGEGFYLYEGFAPTEGFLLDEAGGILMVDEKNMTSAFRETTGDPLRLYGPEDIISVSVSPESPDFLDFKVRDKGRSGFSFEFDDAGEAAYWMEWFLKGKAEKADGRVEPRSRFVALPPLQNI
ncbi:MAG: hypothetical protein FNP40_08075 [Dehalobacter sp. 4CP]|nr:hypothetical protein [Dehalobacter sp. 4CP]